MADPTFRPVLYLKKQCPHCLKLRLFLLEAGLLDRFALREFAPGDPQEAAIREELGQHLAKPSFPTVQYEPGRYMGESDAIITRYAAEYGVDRTTLPAFLSYAEGVLPKYQAARRENKELKERLETAAAG